VGGRAHAELLAPSIEEVCAASGCRVADIDGVAVDVGPGLFTGLRVGVATAKALAQALSVAVLGVSSLDVLAAAAAARGSADRPERVAAVIDARRGEVFAAAYLFDQSGPADDPASVRRDCVDPLSPEGLAAWLVEVASDTGHVRVVGDGALRYRSVLSGSAALDFGWVDDLAAPPPDALASLARHRLAAGVVADRATDLVPDYRRPADARINWEQREPRPGSSAVSGPGR
jgi:tRNA threonylcarbamoyladenosine biosynthesis protein TsaB